MLNTPIMVTPKDLEHTLVETSIAEELVLFRGSMDIWGPKKDVYCNDCYLKRGYGGHVAVQIVFPGPNLQPEPSADMVHDPLLVVYFPTLFPGPATCLTP